MRATPFRVDHTKTVDGWPDQCARFQYERFTGKPCVGKELKELCRLYQHARLLHEEDAREKIRILSHQHVQGVDSHKLDTNQSSKKATNLVQQTLAWKKTSSAPPSAP